jgi:hypothetical protein
MASAFNRRVSPPAAALATFLLLFVPQHAEAQAPAGPAGTAAGAASSATSPTAATLIPGSPPTTTHGVHVVTVTFDYDFGGTPACTAKITKHCVTQFIAYDVSDGVKTPVLLFPIPLPSNPVGVVKGITKASPPLDFQSGKHLVSVSAMSADGTHSKRSLCTTWITIP